MDRPLNHEFIHPTNREQLRRLGVRVVNEVSMTSDGEFTIANGAEVQIDITVAPTSDCNDLPVELAWVHLNASTAGLKVKYEKGVPSSYREVSAHTESGFFPVFNGPSRSERTVRLHIKNSTGGSVSLSVAPIVYAHLHRK